nr:uncharacterized protein LOC111503676 [Leptinotarsa decemlineata]
MTSVRIITLVLLPVKVMCDVSSLVGGYHYPQLHPPVQFDETPAPDPPGVYLPPQYQDEVIPPFPVPDPTYLPPLPPIYPPLATPPDIFSDEDTIAISTPPPSSLYQAPSPQMKIVNMSCVQDSFFKSTFRLNSRSFSPPPVIDDGVDGCITSGSAGVHSIDMEGSRKMASCGVRRCSAGSGSRANMCVVVRMPTVKGVKLPEDFVVTLQCIPQESIVSHTKQIRLGPTSVERGRSSNNAIVASGGGKQKFHSQMVLLRKSPGSNNFDQILQSGSVVFLGEDIILRAIVQDGDGWKFSRMGPVTLRSSNSQKSLTLVEENGCRSPGMKLICPFQPRQLSPLDTMLHFRAFLFQDSQRGDDMVLSVKMLGCLHSQDCFRNGICDQPNLSAPSRSKRSIKNNDTTNWESQIQFRVQMSQEDTPRSGKFMNQFHFSTYHIVIFVIGIFITVLLLLFIFHCYRKNS